MEYLISFNQAAKDWIWMNFIHDRIIINYSPVLSHYTAIKFRNLGTENTCEK